MQRIEDKILAGPPVSAADNAAWQRWAAAMPTSSEGKRKKRKKRRRKKQASYCSCMEYRTFPPRAFRLWQSLVWLGLFWGTSGKCRRILHCSRRNYAEWRSVHSSAATATWNLDSTARSYQAVLVQYWACRSGRCFQLSMLQSLSFAQSCSVYAWTELEVLQDTRPPCPRV